MPIAKTAAQAQPAPVVLQDSPAQPMQSDRPVVHPEVMRFFNVNPLEVEGNDKLRLINDWAMQDAKHVGEALKKIRSLEIKLGSAKMGEDKINSIYNWVRLSNNVSSVLGEMKTEISKVSDSAAKEIARLRESGKERIGKLSSEIENIERSLRDAVRKFRLNANNQTLNIKKQYETRLAELKAMRAAYKGGK